MKSILKVEEHSVHLWQACVPELLSQIPAFSVLLDENEIARAKRFHFDEHRQRYIVAHAVLRKILSLYTAISPEKMEFVLGPRGKPYLKENKWDLQFNVSHSHDRIVYALTHHVEVGVDIEKIEPHFDEGVAKRFFSAKEYAELMTLPEEKKISAFYRLWAGREAVIKALGEGLYAPLADFSLDLSQEAQTIKLMDDHYHLEYFFVDAGYQAAFATSQTVQKVIYQPPFIK